MTMKICPGCGAMLTDNTKFCTNCGRKLIEEVSAQATAQTAAAGQAAAQALTQANAAAEQAQAAPAAQQPLPPAQPLTQEQQAAQAAAQAVPPMPMYPTPPTYEQTYAAQQVQPIVYNTTQATAVTPVGGKGLAIASLICGIVSIVSSLLCCMLLFQIVSFITGILAIVFSSISKKQAQGGPKNGMATAGLILGIAGLIISVIMIIIRIVIFILMASGFNNGNLDYFENFVDY